MNKVLRTAVLRKLIAANMAEQLKEVRNAFPGIVLNYSESLYGDDDEYSKLYNLTWNGLELVIYIKSFIHAGEILNFSEPDIRVIYKATEFKTNYRGVKAFAELVK